MRAFAALALLVLGLGLPRLVVLCDHGDGTAALEFAHAEGTCCRDHADAEPLAHETGERGGDAHSGGGTCQHRDLVVELAPAPRPVDGAIDTPPPPCGRLVAVVPPAPALRRALPRPPATGPPRTDGAVALRRTTQLLL